MKRTISFLSALAFVLAFSGSVFAQSVDIGAGANVITQIQASQVDSIAFGDLDPNFSTSPSLDETTGSTNNTSGTANIGIIQLNAEGGQSVNVSWNGSSNTTTLSDGSGNTITYNIQVASTDDNLTTGATGFSASSLSNGNPVTIDSNDGTSSITVGGNLDTPSSALPSGVYSTSITFNFDYSL